MQLTSMMDCIFLILIFFLVSSQLKKIEKEIPVELPEAHAASAVKKELDILKVAVTAGGEHFVDGKSVGPGGLRLAIGAAAKAPGRRVRIDGDIGAPFGAIVEVVDACQQHGLRVVGIHTASGLDK